MTSLNFNQLKETDAIWLPQIPKHWEFIKVRHLFKESTKKGFPNETLLVASQEHGVVSKDIYGKRTVEATKDLHNLKLVEQGDFVISLRSFQGGIELAHERGIISPAYTILKETQPINKRYFKNLFKSSPFISLMNLCLKGIREGQNIDYPTFKNEYLPVPPIKEQNIISEYLDKKISKINLFVKNKEKLINLLEELKSQVILKLTTKGLGKHEGIKESKVGWLGEIPNHWELKKLKYICNIEYGISTQLDGRFKTGTPIISLPNISIFGDLNVDDTDFYQLSNHERKRFLLRKNDLLFNWRNGSPEHVGKTAIFNLDGEFTHVSFLLRLRFDSLKAHNRYFRHFINGLRLAGFFNSSRQKINMTFNKSELNNFVVTVPPIDEQILIVKSIDKELTSINTQIEIIYKEIAAIKEYREALITDLVTGKRSIPQT